MSEITLDGNAKPALDAWHVPTEPEPLPTIELEEFPRLLVITSPEGAEAIRAKLPELEIMTAPSIEAHVCGPRTSALLQSELGGERICVSDGMSIDSPSQAKWASVQVERAAERMVILLDTVVSALTRQAGRKVLPSLSEAGLCEQWRSIRDIARDADCWPLGKPLTEADRKPVEFTRQVWLGIREGTHQVVGIGLNEESMRTAWEVKGYTVVGATVRGSYIPPEAFPYIKKPF